MQPNFQRLFQEDTHSLMEYLKKITCYRQYGFRVCTEQSQYGRLENTSWLPIISSRLLSVLDSTLGVHIRNGGTNATQRESRKSPSWLHSVYTLRKDLSCWIGGEPLLVSSVNCQRFTCIDDSVILSKLQGSSVLTILLFCLN